MKQAIDIMNIKTPEWGIEEITGYKPKTTFWKDFSIAERMNGLNGVQETFNKAFKEWSDKYRYLTELVLVLNWKCWYWHDQGDDDLSTLYQNLFYQATEYALDNLKDEELSYFWEPTD